MKRLGIEELKKLPDGEYVIVESCHFCKKVPEGLSCQDWDGERIVTWDKLSSLKLNALSFTTIYFKD